MSKSKDNCSDCIHINVCEWAVEGQEIICNDFIDRKSLERPHGEWIKEEDTGLVGCSNCHIVWLRGITKFCPNCGADMRGDDT